MGGKLDSIFGAKDADMEDLSGKQMGARAGAGAIAGGLKGAGQPQQPRSGGAAPIQVTPTPDVSGFYQQQPLQPVAPIQAPPSMDPNDPRLRAMYGRG